MQVRVLGVFFLKVGKMRLWFSPPAESFPPAAACTASGFALFFFPPQELWISSCSDGRADSRGLLLFLTFPSLSHFPESPFTFPVPQSPLFTVFSKLSSTETT